MKVEGPIREGEVPAYKQASYDLVPRGARHVLDVGCGSGEDVLSLAERLGATTLVVGLDASLERIDEAQRAARNVALNVRFAVGDARSLPFSDGSFDVVRADGLLGVAEERARVVRELTRVTVPGGRVLVHDDEAPVSTQRDEEATEDDLLSLMRRAGLVSLERSYLAPRPASGSVNSVTLSGIKPAPPEEGPAGEH
jgi:ubiquinone/menaquinone biosynthesis C-methylase UbiE